MADWKLWKFTDRTFASVQWTGDNLEEVARFVAEYSDNSNRLATSSGLLSIRTRDDDDWIVARVGWWIYWLPLSGLAVTSHNDHWVPVPDANKGSSPV